MPGRFPARAIEPLPALHDGQQQRHELARDRADGLRLEPAIAREQGFVIAPVQTAALAPAAGEQEELFSHAYGMRSVYDANRRLVTLHHPLQLAPAPHRSTQYAYNPVTGELSTVTDALGKVWTFDYNLRGERIRLSLPGGIRDSAAYDLDGRIVAHWVKNSSPSPWALAASELRHDAVCARTPKFPRFLNRQIPAPDRW